MNVMMNVRVYDKTKYLESAVSSICEGGGGLQGYIVNISDCEHNIDINPSPDSRVGLLTTHSITADD